MKKTTCMIIGLLVSIQIIAMDTTNPAKNTFTITKTCNKNLPAVNGTTRLTDIASTPGTKISPYTGIVLSETCAYNDLPSGMFITRERQFEGALLGELRHKVTGEQALFLKDAFETCHIFSKTNEKTAETQLIRAALQLENKYLVPTALTNELLKAYAMVFMQPRKKTEANDHRTITSEYLKRKLHQTENA